MNEYEVMIEKLMQNITAQIWQSEDVETRNGIMYCRKCGEPRQEWIDWLPDRYGKPRRKLVPVPCRCAREAEERQKAEDRKREFENNLRQMRDRAGVDIRGYANTFEDDDTPDSKISKTCRSYVEEWEPMRKNGTGILLFGAKGTGKSFYAACIVNALAERQVATAMMSVPDLIGLMQIRDRAGIAAALKMFPLLVLDDLGAERDTPYAAELVYSVVDARYRAKLPTIITTNLDTEDMANERDLLRSRIYDRVLQMCPIAIRMQGESKRAEIAERLREKARAVILRSIGGKNG